MSQSVLVLCAAFAVKHFLCDFFLQTPWMAANKGTNMRVLALHAGIHALGTFSLTFWVGWPALGLALADFAVHALADRSKCLAGSYFGLMPIDAPYWWLFGADQFVHALTDLAIIWAYVEILAL